MKRRAAEVNELAITPAERGFLRALYPVPEILTRMLFSKQRALKLCPPPARARHMRLLRVRAGYCLWCDPSEAALLPLFLPPVFRIRLSLSPRRLRGDSSAKKTALIWFPRLTFRAPGAARGRTLSSSSRSLFSPVPFSPFPRRVGIPSHATR